MRVFSNSVARTFSFGRAVWASRTSGWRISSSALTASPGAPWGKAYAAADAARSMSREAFERALRTADAQEGADEAEAMKVAKELRKPARGGR